MYCKVLHSSLKKQNVRELQTAELALHIVRKNAIELNPR